VERGEHGHLRRDTRRPHGEAASGTPRVVARARRRARGSVRARSIL